MYFETYALEMIKVMLHKNRQKRFRNILSIAHQTFLLRNINKN